MYKRYRFLGLKKYEIYTVQISAQNAEGEGPRSKELTVKTLEDGMLHKCYLSTCYTNNYMKVICMRI